METSQHQGRLMPIMDLEGKRFFVDIRLQEMRQVDDFMNSISFHDLLSTKKSDKLLLTFDHTTNNIYNRSLEGKLPANISLLELPNVREWITPETQQYYANWADFHEKRQLPEVVYASVTKSGLKQHPVNDKGLPVIEFDGTEFCIDQQKQQLVQQTNSKNTISFRKLKGEGDHYTLVYDRMHKNVYGAKNYNPHIHVEVIQIPREKIGKIELKKLIRSRSITPDNNRKGKKL